MSKVKRKFVVLSINPGMGAHLQAYEDCGAEVRLALETRKPELSQLVANSSIQAEPIDHRWFYNRKQKGLDDLLARLGLAELGDLDVLEVTSELEAFGRQKHPQNLFDAFGIARRLEPKAVIAFGSADLLQNTDAARFQSFLDYLRFDNLRLPTRKKRYFVTATLVDASRFGAGVSKQYTLIVGLRADLAERAGISTDQGLDFLIPRGATATTVGDRLQGIAVSDSESEFWTLRTRADPKAGKALPLLSKNPERPEIFNPTARLKADLGFPKSWVPTVARASNRFPAPDPAKFTILHPQSGRQLGLTELRHLFGLPSSWRFTLSDLDAYNLLSHSVPVGLASAVFRDFAVPALSGQAKVAEGTSPTLKRIRQAETLRSDHNSYRTYLCEIDLGPKAGKEMEGGTPDFSDFDYLFDANEINEDFTVYGPFDPILGRRPIIGAVKRRIYSTEERGRFVKAIRKIKDQTEKRLTCATLPITKERIAKYESEARRFELSDDGFAIRLWVDEKKDGTPAHWDSWRTEPMPSATVGWLRDRNSKIPQFAGKRDEAFVELNRKAEAAYLKLAPIDFAKQRTFLTGRVPREYRLGGSVFTTLAVNQYGDEMPAMGYHQDTGDNNSGLTTISVFDLGKYTGGYFVIPRYRCAFRVGDSDVFVANSREWHGVSALTGAGQRLSVVSYTKTDLAFKQDDLGAYPAKSPRPNFRWDQYRVCIVLPKAGGSSVRTEAFLRSQGVAAERIAVLPFGESINEYFAEGTPVIFMTGDVDGYLTTDRGIHLVGKNFIKDVVRRGLDACRENNAYLFSWNNSWSLTNGDERDAESALARLEEKVQVGEFHPAPTLVGVVMRKALQCQFDGTEKSALEMGAEHFRKDGRIVRLCNVSDLDRYEYADIEGVTLPGKAAPIEQLVRIPTPQPSLSERQILALGGVPASGKTTIMREFLSCYGPWEPVRLGKTLDAHYSAEADFYVLGDYSDEAETFAGTDRLSMNVQPDAVAFLASLKPTTKVLYEGARLFTGSFFDACQAAGLGYEILEIVADAKTLTTRHRQRGDKQSKKFLQTQESKVRNVVRSPRHWRHTISMPNNTGKDQAEILSHLRQFIGLPAHDKDRALDEVYVAPGAPRVDYRLKKNRQLGFDHFYRFHCETNDCSPDIAVERWIADDCDFDFEKRSVLGLFHGAVHAGPTETIFAENFPVLTGDSKSIIEFYQSNKKRLIFSPDCRYRRMVFERFLESVCHAIAPYGTLGTYIRSCFSSDNRKQNYLNLQTKCLGDWYNWGRMGHWSFSEAIARFIDAPIEPPTMEFAKGKSHRSGWAFRIGRDDLTGDKISRADCEYLERTAAAYIATCDFPNANFFTLETACCNYKRQHRGSRYGGCYIDEQYDDIVEARKLWQEYDWLWDKYLEGRAAVIPESLLFEKNTAGQGTAYLKDWVKCLKDHGSIPRVEAWLEGRPQRWVSLKDLGF